MNSEGGAVTDGGLNSEGEEVQSSFLLLWDKVVWCCKGLLSYSQQNWPMGNFIINMANC